MRYQFGDSDRAAQRLAELARVFDAGTRRFVTDAAPERAGRIADLGCGPGFTTRLLADNFPGAEVAGIDDSEPFLELAREDSRSNLRFIRQDVRETAPPGGPYDLIFCRFLLSHLGAPEPSLTAWASALSVSGRLLCEEVERIDTTLPVFRRYLGIVAALLADQGSELYIGPRLSAAHPAAGLSRVVNRLEALTPPNHDAASMFCLNIPNWKDRPFIRDNYDSNEINELLIELQSLADSRGAASQIEWSLRQVAWQRC